MIQLFIQSEKKQFIHREEDKNFYSDREYTFENKNRNII